MRRRHVLLLLAAAALAAIFAFVVLPFQREIAAHRERVIAGSQIAETACGPIEYATTGEGPVALAVHGAGGGWDQGMDLGGALQARGFRVVAVSRFGYLRSPLPDDASPEAQADAFACLLDSLGIDRVTILGASAGAPSTLQFAIRHPQRTAAMVLLVPATYMPHGEGEQSLKTPSGTDFLFDSALKSDFLFWALLRWGTSFAEQAILATPPEVIARAGAQERARVDSMLQHILPVSQRRLGLLNDTRIVSTLKRFPLERIDAPTLIASCRDDLYGTFEPAQFTAGQIKGARFLGYKSCGHILVGHEYEIMEEVARLRER